MSEIDCFNVNFHAEGQVEIKRNSYCIATRRLLNNVSSVFGFCLAKFDIYFHGLLTYFACRTQEERIHKWGRMPEGIEQIA
jgi:hypothetical protein